MNDLMMDMPICDYCNIVIDPTIEPIVETQITNNNPVSSTIVEVAHRNCWIAINTVVDAVIEYSRVVNTKRVDNDSQVV